MNLPALSLLETRVLGVLVEKQHTVPDTYPLTLNALVAGCNQKTSREPLLNATDAEVQAAIDQLRSLSFVVETSGGRVMRYAHNVERVLGVPAQAVALLAVLMLRGPQTVAELRQQQRAAAPLCRHFRRRGLSRRARRRGPAAGWSPCCRASPARARPGGRTSCPGCPTSRSWPPAFRAPPTGRSPSPRSPR